MIVRIGNGIYLNKFFGLKIKERQPNLIAKYRDSVHLKFM